MRSFSTILATIALPLYALAAHHGNHARDHSGVALRARGDVLPKREFSSVRMTYYDITVGPVACGGATYGANDFVVALNHPQFGDGAGTSQYCGQTITITYNGVTVNAVIVDECMGCPYGGIDCTEGLFKALAGSLGPGVIYGSWSFGNGAPAPKPEPTTTTPKYTPPKTTSTPHYEPPPPTSTTTWTPPPPPPSSSSTSTSKTSSWVSTTSTTSTTSQSHSHSSSSPAASSSSSSSVVPSPTGVADPAGTVDDGQTNAIADIYSCIGGLGQIIVSSF